MASRRHRTGSWSLLGPPGAFFFKKSLLGGSLVINAISANEREQREQCEQCERELREREQRERENNYNYLIVAPSIFHAARTYSVLQSVEEASRTNDNFRTGHLHYTCPWTRCLTMDCVISQSEACTDVQGVTEDSTVILSL